MHVANATAAAAPSDDRKKRRRQEDLTYERIDGLYCCKTCPQKFAERHRMLKHEKNMMEARATGMIEDAACAAAAAMDALMAVGRTSP